MDLARRGIKVAVIEQRQAGEPPSVRCNHVAARSMELFRRLGVARRLRDAGLPADYPNDVSFRTTMLGRELTRIPIPCRRDRYSATGGPDTWWPTPEPPHRINQIFLEPILFAHALAQERIAILNRAELLDLDQDEAGVTARVKLLDTGGTLTASARYLVGCDGARSEVRRQIGAKLLGDAVVQRTQSSYIRAPRLLAMQQGPRAWVNFSLNPRRVGSVFAIDGRETFLIHNYLREDETDFESIDRDDGIRNILGVGRDFEYEILAKEDWFGRRLVADIFRDRRVFLCGDAAHIWVPYAGYGMNAGLADAANLAWLMAARLKGWGGPAILDAYERERRPITEQVSHFAMGHAQAMARQRGSVPPEIEDETPQGDQARAELGKWAYELNVQQYCCGGLNFGYFYDSSPIIVYDGEPQPGYSMANFTPSTVPGCRTPHIWLADGASLYDAMGPDFTLLRFDASVAVEPLLEAARSRGLPLALLDLPRSEATAVYKEALILSRPDQHVAWRGDAVPADPLGLVDRVRGAAP
jgi:2-polyprenyl-6-methoxyphenol hydroxylase-like FAD-dependent oxidoreductase